MIERDKIGAEESYKGLLEDQLQKLVRMRNTCSPTMPYEAIRMIDRATVAKYTDLSTIDLGAAEAIMADHRLWPGRYQQLLRRDPEENHRPGPGW